MGSQARVEEPAEGYSCHVSDQRRISDMFPDARWGASCSAFQRVYLTATQAQSVRAAGIALTTMSDMHKLLSDDHLSPKA